MHQTIEQKKALLQELVSPELFYQDHVSIASEMAVRAEVGRKIYSIATSLLQAMEASDGQSIDTGPNNLLFYIRRVNSLLGPDRFYGPDFHLSDLEDLYYAACGKAKDLRQCAEIHLRNGFTKPDEPYIYLGEFDASNVASVLLKDFLSVMAAEEAVLYSDEVVDPLHQAILRKNMLTVLEGKSDLPPSNGSPRHAPNHDRMLCQGVRCNGLGACKTKAALEAQGLQDMQRQSCAMIFATLSEKYHTILAVEADERAQERKRRRLQKVQFDRWDTLLALCGGSILRDNPRVPGVHGKNRQPLSQVNPHDLTSRIEKLDDPNAPNHPCLCDPDCLCAPLCAGEPDEDCLCETNPLFWRVTTGYEIEELLCRAKDEMYPFQSRYNRLAQLTMGGLGSPGVPIITHASGRSSFADCGGFDWYCVIEQQSQRKARQKRGVDE